MRGVAMVAVAALACGCGGKKDAPTEGACTFRGPDAPTAGYPAGLQVCFDRVHESACKRPDYDGLPAFNLVFTAGKTCMDLGWKRCDQPLKGFEVFKPCELSKAAATGFTMPPPAPPGPAYIALHGGAAVMLPDGTLQKVTGATGWVSHFTLGADGGVYATSGADSAAEQSFVWKLDGAAATKVATVKSYVVTGLAVAKDGTIYVGANDKVLTPKGGKTVTLPPAPGISMIHELAFDADGHLVTTGNGTLAVLNGDAWQTQPIPGAQSFDEA